jgi:hypothetical protein
MVREIPKCFASIRTLQRVLPWPGRVFSVESRIFCTLMRKAAEADMNLLRCIAVANQRVEL